MRTTTGKVPPNRLKEGAGPGARIQSLPIASNAANQRPRRQGRPTATHHHGISPAHSPEAAHGHCRARNDMAAALKTTSSLSTTFDRGDSPSSYPIGRARLELVRNRCPPLPLGCTQGSHCSGGAVVCCEPERARWHDRPVLGRWLGLTPERPSLCLRRRPEAAQGGPESG